jgi:Xaa-Pro aminopeptidase
MADAYATRTAAVAALIRARELDALLVSAPANVRYLAGYSGTNGVVLVAAADRAEHTFFTDFRYETQAAEEVAALFARKITPVDLLGVVAGALAGASAGADAHTGRLGFDENHLTVSQHAKLAGLLEGSWELAPCGGVVEALREVKDEQELKHIRAAAQLADDALSAVLEAGLAGRSEREIATELELHMRRLGADGASFPTIVASGPHAALPHAQPRASAIAPGELVTIDWGAFHAGYCSDCTRTFASGPPNERQRQIYELVLDAQEKGLAALRAGRTGAEVDASARAVIDEAGYGAHFGHGLGHGVGIEVHEGPRLSRLRADAPLRAGNVVTVEPGVYLPGELGVRIEDLVVVTTEGSCTLSSLPKELTTIS